MNFSVSPVLNRTADIFLNSHIWLGCCAVACTAGTYLLLHQDIQLIYICFVFFGTVTIYNLHTYFGQILKTKGKNPVLDFQHLPLYLRIILPVGGIMTLLFYFFLTLQNKILILLPGTAAILYVLPFLHGKRLRDFPFLKIFLIIIAWTTVTYGAPLLRMYHWWSHSESFYFLAERLFFFFALALPFDIRDIESDHTLKLKTIPNSLGILNSQLLSLSAIIFAVSLLIIPLHSQSNSALPAALVLVYIFLGFLILKVNKKQNHLFYIFILDGLIFLYGMSLIVTSLFLQ